MSGAERPSVFGDTDPKLYELVTDFGYWTVRFELWKKDRALKPVDSPALERALMHLGYVRQALCELEREQERKIHETKKTDLPSVS
jgi:hypothetical protein